MRCSSSAFQVSLSYGLGSCSSKKRPNFMQRDPPIVLAFSPEHCGYAGAVSSTGNSSTQRATPCANGVAISSPPSRSASCSTSALCCPSRGEAAHHTSGEREKRQG